MRKIVALSSILTAAMTVAAMAEPNISVPEIDAGAGTAVVAALGASVALLFERRRRRK
jgi:hypothetical protein